MALFEDIVDDLEYKGVVYNEMKSDSSDSILWKSNNLYSDTTYGLDSGGNPEQIPELTYHNFKNFINHFITQVMQNLFFMEMILKK